MAKKVTRNLTRQYIRLLFSAVGILTAVGLSYWSFLQTRDFMRMFDETVQGFPFEISYAFSLFVQYTQNIWFWLATQEGAKVSFLRNKIDDIEKSKNKSSYAKRTLFRAESELSLAEKKRLGYWLLYASFISVDIFTNIGQLEASGKVIGAIQRVVGWAAMAGVAFVEEGIPEMLTSFGTAFNDIRQASGKKRISGVESLIDEARDAFGLDEQYSKDTGGFGGDSRLPGGQTKRGQKAKSKGAQQQSSKKQSVRQRNKPTYPPQSTFDRDEFRR